MRTFVALPAPPAGGPHRYLEACQQALRDDRPDVKWVAPEHLHVTLRFLGEVEEATLPEVRDAVRAAAAGLEPFRVRLGRWGAFPSPERPQTLWVGVAEGADRMAALEHALTERMKAAGIPPDRKAFHPHITLGRMRSSRGSADVRARLRTEPPRAGETEFPARHITLFESRLTPDGPVYTALLEAPLGGA